MQNKVFALIVIFVVGISVSACDGSKKSHSSKGQLGDTSGAVAVKKDTMWVADLSNLEIPMPSSDCELVKHKYYTLCYDEPYEEAKWVAYKLTKEEANGKLPRKDAFRADPLVPTGSAIPADYKTVPGEQKYDKGHLCNNADMSFDSIAQSETFYMSNMTPQIHSFNAGIWLTLEKKVREWANQDDTVDVVAGPILHSGLKTIGQDKVAVPEYFYKVILAYTGKVHSAIGFIFPHEKATKPLKDFAVSVDSVEKVTGIDFFPSLPDSEENALESKVELNKWGL
ncbi:MAG: DNA/RNA non-specific endonuclease [Chitinispirillaceae bacterium]|jgi:endonuclease G